MQLPGSLGSDDEANFNKMKTAYDACLDEETIKSLGTSPLMAVLSRIKTAFPVDTSSSLHRSSVKDVESLLAGYGISALVSPGTGADDTDTDTVVVQLAAPWSIGLPSK